MVHNSLTVLFVRMFIHIQAVVNNMYFRVYSTFGVRFNLLLIHGAFNFEGFWVSFRAWACMISRLALVCIILLILVNWYRYTMFLLLLLLF